MRRPLVQREYCDLVPGDPAQRHMQREVALSPESCADGQQPIGVTINAEVSHSKLFECSLECSYVQKLPLEHPHHHHHHPLPVDFKHRKKRGQDGVKPSVLSWNQWKRGIWKTARQLGRHAAALIPINLRYTEKLAAVATTAAQRETHPGVTVK